MHRNLLPGPRSDLEQIADDMRKIRGQAGAFAKA